MELAVKRNRTCWPRSNPRTYRAVSTRRFEAPTENPYVPAALFAPAPRALPAVPARARTSFPARPQAPPPSRSKPSWSGRTAAPRGLQPKPRLRARATRARVGRRQKTAKTPFPVDAAPKRNLRNKAVRRARNSAKTPKRKPSQPSAQENSETRAVATGAPTTPKRKPSQPALRNSETKAVATRACAGCWNHLAVIGTIRSRSANETRARPNPATPGAACPQVATDARRSGRRTAKTKPSCRAKGQHSSRRMRGIPREQTQNKKKRPRGIPRGRYKLTRQRPTLPHGCPCSTIGSEELDFRVRDGIGYGLLDIATGNVGHPKARQ